MTATGAPTTADMRDYGDPRPARSRWTGREWVDRPAYVFCSVVEPRTEIACIFFEVGIGPPGATCRHMDGDACLARRDGGKP